jgi:phosphotriesterase-related protein
MHKNSMNSNIINKNDGAVQTVTGTIHPNELGYCQSHEHLFLADGPIARKYPALRLDDLEATCAELELYRNIGGRSVVDAQPVGCSRMADLHLLASKRTGIKVIASTGFHKLIFYPKEHWIHQMDSDHLTQLFTQEIEKGMYVRCDDSKPSEQINAKAGVIKTASDEQGPGGEYEKLFHAAANTAVKTGLTVLSHTEMGKCALEQIRFFSEYHIAPESIVICHLDRVLTDMQYLMEVASTGVYLELDTIGRPKYHSDEDEARFIAKLVDNGHENQILLGLDTTRERMRSYGGAIGLDYMLTSFLPLLRSFGIDNDIIGKFTISNPAMAFSIKTHNQKGEQ